jgi:hypothetical protein
MNLPDYEYVKTHPEEYAEQFAAFKAHCISICDKNLLKKATDQEVDEILWKLFPRHLLRTGVIAMPKRCQECPFYEVEYIGVFRDVCALATNMFIPDFFFAAKKKRPKWCPLERGKK